MSAVAWFLAGVITLTIGAELVVRGGTRLAASLGVPPLVVGLTVISVGTSAPELAIGVDAARMGHDSLAVGNIAGTNTVNLLFILGLSAAIRPLVVKTRVLRVDLPVIVASAITLILLSLDGSLSSTDGLLMLLAALAYTVAVVRSARLESLAVREEFEQEFGVDEHTSIAERIKLVVYLLVGIGVIVVGAQWLVDGAVDVARILGVSDAVIGLTVVAIGTSAPELFTTIVATIRHERDIAVGNLFGSSIYNILAILGVTAFVSPAGMFVDADILRIDLPFMLLVTVACVPVFLTGRKITRIEAASFIGAYLAYLAYLIIART